MADDVFILVVLQDSFGSDIMLNLKFGLRIMRSAVLAESDQMPAINGTQKSH